MTMMVDPSLSSGLIKGLMPGFPQRLQSGQYPANDARSNQYVAQLGQERPAGKTKNDQTRQSRQGQQ